ncbi:hypothetical protein Hanom_Chr02g00135281 [Helianthus anomalus]
MIHETRCFLITPLYQLEHVNLKTIQNKQILEYVLSNKIKNTLHTRQESSLLLTNTLILFLHKRLEEHGAARHDLIFHEPHRVSKTTVRHNSIVAG